MRLLFVSLLFLSTVFSGTARAAFLTVTSTNDSGAGTLRNVLAAASNGDVIVFALPGAAPHVVNVDTALGVKRNVTILGPGSASLTIRKGSPGQYTVFDIDTGITAAISGLTIADGTGAKGGCVRHAGTSLALSAVVVRDCTATDSLDARGGGVFVEATAGELTVADSTFTGCSAAIGGGIAVNDGTAVAVVEDCAFTNNTASLAGGGLYHGGQDLRLARGRFDNNSSAGGNAGGGGGLYVSAGAGDTAVSQSAFINNTSTGAVSFGGGIAAVHLTPATSFTVDSSLFVGNAAQIGAGLVTGQTVMTARIINSTFTQNAGSGAAVFSSSPTSSVAMYVDACTFVDNTFGVDAIMQIPGSSAYAVLRNTILANTTNVGGTGNVYSLGHNVVTTSPSGFNADDLLNTDPLVGPLADHGGPTLTFALQPTSPAIDAGSCASLAPIFPDVLGVDQRGEARADGACDIGAYESVILPTGPQGPQGPQGPAGPAGNDGANGADGANGVNGADGAVGPQGPQGPAGADGANGANGTNGTDGQDGADGGCAATHLPAWLVIGLAALLRGRRRYGPSLPA